MDLTKPEGYIFELSTAVLTDKALDDPERYTNWGKPQFSFTQPCVPEGSIRNLRAVYSVVETTVKVDASAALEAVGATAAQLAKIATERNAVIDECISAMDKHRKEGKWDNQAEGRGNYIRDQSLLRVPSVLNALKVNANG